MAKPIQSTPVLSGKNAEKFVDEMLETSKRKINNKEKELLNIIKEPQR